jgi:uncharacterized membrane protein YfcA
MSMDWWWAYLAVGVFVGFFSGLLGIGGGSAMVPLLAFIFAAKGFAPTYVVHLALGTCIAAIMFTAASSVWSHHRHRAVNWRVFARLLPGVVAGAIAGAALARVLDERLLAIVFTALVYYAATLMLIERTAQPKGESPGAAGMWGIGAVVGLFSSLTATGGSAMVVAYLARRNVTIHEAIGTAAAASWALALAGALGYIVMGAAVPGLPEWSVGFVYLPALALIVATSMLMAPVGASVAHRTPGRTLKRIFAGVLFALATGMLVRFF